jgi:hypothetical protein
MTMGNINWAVAMFFGVFLIILIILKKKGK